MWQELLNSRPSSPVHEHENSRFQKITLGHTQDLTVSIAIAAATLFQIHSAGVATRLAFTSETLDLCKFLLSFWTWTRASSLFLQTVAPLRRLSTLLRCFLVKSDLNIITYFHIVAENALVECRRRVHQVEFVSRQFLTSTSKLAVSA